MLRRGNGQRRHPPILRQREIRTRRPQRNPRNLPRSHVRPEHLRLRPLHTRKINAVRPPSHNRRLLIECIAHRTYRAALSRHHRNPRIGVEKLRIPHRRPERDPLPIGSPHRPRIRPRRIDDLLHPIPRQRQHVDVRRPALHQIRILRRAEGNALPVRSPRENAHRIRLPLRPLRAGHRRPKRLRHRQRPQVRMQIVPPYNFKFTQLLLPVLRPLLRGRVRNLCPVRRPLKTLHTGFRFRQRHRLPAVRTQHEHLRLPALSLPRKCQPLPIGRPRRPALRFLPARQLPRAAPARLRQPQVRHKRVLIPIGFAHAVGNIFAIRRNHRATRRLQIQQVVDRGNTGHQRRGNKEKSRNQSHLTLQCRGILSKIVVTAYD